MFARDESLLFALRRRRRFRSTKELHAGERRRRGALRTKSRSRWSISVSDGYTDQNFRCGRPCGRSQRVGSAHRELDRANCRTICRQQIPCNGSARRLTFRKRVVSRHRRRDRPWARRLECDATRRVAPRITGLFPPISGATLPYVFDAGVAGTAPLMMPESGTRRSGRVCVAARRFGIVVFLFARRARARVQLRRRTLARVAMRASRLEIGNVLDVSVNGRGATELAVLGGPKAPAAPVYDTRSTPRAPPVPLTLYVAPATWLERRGFPLLSAPANTAIFVRRLLPRSHRIFPLLESAPRRRYPGARGDGSFFAHGQRSAGTFCRRPGYQRRTLLDRFGRDSWLAVAYGWPPGAIPVFSVAAAGLLRHQLHACVSERLVRRQPARPRHMVRFAHHALEALAASIMTSMGCRRGHCTARNR